jgi:1,4-alpha-glucan branching enzyme
LTVGESGYGPGVTDTLHTAPRASPECSERRSDLSDKLEATAASNDDRPRTTVSFTLPAEIAATSASVVGDFNDWDAERGVMSPDESGGFVCSMAIPTGRRYQYRYLLDGERWTNDWAAHAYAPNPFGGADSVLDLTDNGTDVAGEHERARGSCV